MKHTPKTFLIPELFKLMNTPSTSDNGTTIFDLDEGFRDGSMGHSMRATGITTRLMDRVGSSMPMEISMLGNGRMTRHMGMVPTTTKTELAMWESGLRISSMDKARNNGLTGQFMKGSIKWESSMGKDTSYGVIKVNMKGISCIIIYTEKGIIFGLIKESTLDNGRIIK